MNKTERGGFTLIELLVVVAIISLLAAIAVPNVLGRLRIAKMVKAEAEIKSISTAVEMFYTDTGYFPFYALRRYAWNQWPNDIVRSFYMSLEEAGQLYGTPMLNAILMTTKVYADAGLFRGGVADTVQRNYMAKGIPEDPWKEMYFYSERLPVFGGILTYPRASGGPPPDRYGGVMDTEVEFREFLPQARVKIRTGVIDLDYYIYSMGEDQSRWNPDDEFSENDDISNFDVENSYQKKYRQ